MPCGTFPKSIVLFITKCTTPRSIYLLTDCSSPLITIRRNYLRNTVQRLNSNIISRLSFKKTNQRMFLYCSGKSDGRTPAKLKKGTAKCLQNGTRNSTIHNRFRQSAIQFTFNLTASRSRLKKTVQKSIRPSHPAQVWARGLIRQFSDITCFLPTRAARRLLLLRLECSVPYRGRLTEQQIVQSANPTSNKCFINIVDHRSP